MHVCLICTELYGWGSAGGFGFATRTLGRELIRRGPRVTAVIAQPRGETATTHHLGGMDIM